MGSVMDDLKAGVYRHYKGPLYLVLGLAHDANAENLAPADNAGRPIGSAFGERTVVVYVGLELQQAHTGARLAVRTYDDFFEFVHQDGSTCRNVEFVMAREDCPVCQCGPADGPHSGIVRRFTYVGPTWTGDDTRSTDLETLVKLLASDPSPFGSESFQRIRDQINPRMRALLLDVLS